MYDIIFISNCEGKESVIMFNVKKSITLKLIIINIICFILTVGGMLFSGWFGNNFRVTVLHLQVWRLLTSMFYHFGLMHLICNMFSLINIGFAVEAMYGKKKFLIAYFGTGIVGGLIASFIHFILGQNILSAGASGAICGLLGLLLGSISGNFSSKVRTVFLTILPLLIIGIGSGVDNVCHFTCLFLGVILSKIFKANK